MKISACIITYNEELNLARCLQSIQSLVDEIIIVDSGSKDGTEAIAATFAVRWISHPWEGYVGQKNFAVAQAKYPWVLSIDADEEISVTLRESIQSLRQRAEHPAGYEISRIVEYQGVKIFYGDWYPDRLVRLFQKEFAYFKGGEVHERLEVSGKIERIKGEQGYLWHYTYRDREDRQRRIYHYASLWSKSALKKGKRVAIISPIFHAAWRLFRGFILKRGYQNGGLGWEIAWGNATEVFWKYQLTHTETALDKSVISKRF